MATGGGPPEPSAAQPGNGEEETVPSLLCVQCKTELKDPHLLCCLHLVCKECLGRVDQQDGRLKCPQCEDTSTHPIPQPQHNQRACRPSAAEVQCVPVRCVSLAQHIKHRKLLQKITSHEQILCSNSNCNTPESLADVVCFNCEKFLCRSCNSAHQTMVQFTEGHTVKYLSKLRTLPPSDLRSLVPQSATLAACPCHEERPLQYCCERCNTLLCQDCTVERDLRHRPKYLDRTVVAQHTQFLVVAREAVVRSQAMHQKATERLKAQCTTVDRMREKALQDTKRTFQTIHAAIEKKEEELCNQIIAVSDEMNFCIKERAQSYSRKGEFLDTAQIALSFLRTKGKSHEVVASKTLSHMRQSAATSQCRQEAGKALMYPVVRFLPQQEEALMTAIEGFGHIQTSASAVHCTVDPTPDTVRQYPPVVFTLTAVDSNDIPCSNGGESVQAFLRPRPPVPGPAIKAKVEDEENGKYKMVFHVVYSGECELSVLVNGGHLRGSPFAVQLDAAVLQNGRWVLRRCTQGLGSTKGSLPFPQPPRNLWGVAVSPLKGDVFVVEHGHSQILVFAADHRQDHNQWKRYVYMKTFGQFGMEEGQLMHPVGIDTADGHLYVANQHHKCVSEFSEDGTFIRSFGTEQLNYPRDVLVHRGRVYVADSENNRIAVLSQEGELIGEFGSEGSGNGEFNRTSGVAVSPDGQRLYISDRFNHRVQIFTLEGQFVRAIGIGHLKNPRGLIVTNEGSLLVADRDNNRVAVFNQEGELVHSIAVIRPVYLAVDSRGDLLVSSATDKSVYYF